MALVLPVADFSPGPISVMAPNQMDENGKMKGGFELRAIGELLV